MAQQQYGLAAKFKDLFNFRPELLPSTKNRPEALKDSIDKIIHHLDKCKSIN